MKNCECHTDIAIDGSGQLTRFLTALDPTYAKVDDRSLTDLIVFAKKYANIIRFYKLNNDDCKEEKTWNNFFKNDFAIIASELSSYDLNDLQSSYIQIRDQFEASPTIPNFALLFKPIVGICTQLDHWLFNSTADFPMYGDIQLAIKSTLTQQIISAFVIDKSAMLVNNGNDLGLEFNPKMEPIWDLDNAEILIKTDIYLGTTLAEQLFHASLQIDTIFNACFAVISKIVGKADEYLSFSLEKYPKHQPHMALFLAFLQVFKLAQDQINGLTERHLNYYYRDILHLTEKPAQPDQVNLIFELAKGIDTYPLTKGAQILAGKDELGIEQIYETDAELVINKAKIVDIKNVFLLKNEANANKVKFYARPIANSADGFGAEFTTDDKKWNPYGVDSVKKQGSCGDIILKKGTNSAQIGFAIASPQLLLEGGNRKIELKIKGLSQLLENKSEAIKIMLSAEKGWLEITKGDSDIFKNFTGNKFSANFETSFALADNDTIHIFLPIKEKAIINYDTKIHADYNFNSTQPVLQVLLTDSVEIDTEIVSKINLNEFSLKVIVGSINNDVELPANFDGVRKLVLQNHEMDIKSETFNTFGVYPAIGSSLYVGSTEVFNKQLSELSLNMDWLSTTQYIQNRSFGLSILNNRTFNGLKVNGDKYFSDLTIKKDILAENQSPFPNNRIKNIENVVKYIGAETDHGFLKLSLLEDKPIIIGDIETFALADPMVSHAVINTVSVEQRYINGLDSQAKGVSLSYRSEILALDNDLDQFFHVYPFGTAEIIQNDEKRREELDENNLPVINLLPASILPNFKYATTLERSSNRATNQYSGTIWQEGNLYIGIENLVPPQNLSILFQIADGTGIDDDKDLPKIHWSFLSNNQWKPLPDTGIISDTTYGLQTTGIVLMDIPAEITNNNTLITNGLHWLAATVDEGSHRMPFIINIVAQAVAATFKNQNNADSHFQNPLPANSITKLTPKPAEIKKIEQPFETFDGVPAEIGKEFWTRVSERLRHKDRAITASDYEKLVLEYFPQVFKIKAITHTDPNCLCREPEKSIVKRGNTFPDGQDGTPNRTEICCGPQVAPGHVMVVPIENLRNRNSVNILQPKTSRRILLEIEQFLQKRTSPFVKVHARNPVYEEVLTAFRVQFKSGVDKGFYLTLLNEEIKKYLTPWVYDQFVDVKFGGQIFASNVINFIEERPYVDFITDFMLFVIKCDCCKSDNPPSKPGNLPKNYTARDVWNFINDESESLDEIEKRLETAIPNYDKYESGLIKELGNYFDTNYEDIEDINLTLATLVEASSPRSLLVSVQNHVIMLYEEDPVLTPCEKKAQKITPILVKKIDEKPIEKVPIEAKLATESPNVTTSIPADSVPKPAKSIVKTNKKPKK